MNLILDVKIVIASHDKDVWFKLMMIDEEFESYTYTQMGLQVYRDAFVTIEKLQFQTWYRLGDISKCEYPFNDMTVWYTLNPKGVQYKLCIHRDFGPAVIRSDSQAWYQYDLLHRIDGPAVDNETQEMYYEYGRLSKIITKSSQSLQDPSFAVEG